MDGAHNYPLNDSLTEDVLAKRAAIEIAANRHVDHWKEVLDYCNAHNVSDGYEVSVKMNGYAHEAEALMDSVFAPSESYHREPSSAYRNNTINQLITALLRVDSPTYDTDPDVYLGRIQVPALLHWIHL